MRWILALLLILSPLVGDRISLPLYAVVFGAILSHDGLATRSVLGSLALILLIEIGWGIDLGTLSLAYIVTALLLRLVEGVVSFTPLSRVHGWPAVSVIRSAVAALALTGVMASISILVQAFVYGHGDAVSLFASSYGATGFSLPLVVVASVVVLAALHRIQTPFKRTIVFGG